MAKIEYKVITSQEISGENGMERLVNDAIQEGWIPQGGIGADDINYFQAMIREK